MATVLGLSAVLKHGAAGATAATVITNVSDVTLNLSKGETDVTTRAANGWRQIAATLKDASIEFTMVWDTADAAFTAIKNAWLNNTLIALLCLDGSTAGVSQGLDADFEILNFTREEPLEEALKVRVTAKPGRGSRAPAWYTLP